MMSSLDFAFAKVEAKQPESPLRDGAAEHVRRAHSLVGRLGQKGSGPQM